MILAEDEKVEVVYSVKDGLRAPVKKNQEVGTVYIYVDGDLFRTFSILAKSNVRKKDFNWYFLNIFNEIMF